MLLKRALIGLVTFGLAVGAFCFYSQYQRTPNISRHPLGGFHNAFKQSDGLGGQGSEVVGVQIDDVRKFDFEDRDDDYRIYQKWGFETILHRGPGVLQVVNPYLTLFESDLTCYVRAGRGVFRIDEINSNTYLRDGTFSAAVQVHILPKPGSDMEEVFIDLDDIVFQSNKSQFSSSGQISVRSPSIQLSGRGVDFVYNKQLKSIQYFRMVALDYLRVRTTREGGLFSFDKEESPSSESSDVPDANGVMTAVADVNVSPEPELQRPIYTCLLKDNVVIRTPKQKIHSLSHIALTDILWPKSSFGRTGANSVDPNVTLSSVVDVNDPTETDPNSLVTVAVLPEADMLDFIITCDRGILVTPADSHWTPESEGLTEPDIDDVVDVNMPSFEEDVIDEGIFLAQDIVYNVQTKDARAEGPVELTFYASDTNEMETQGHLIPINVTARKYGQFDANDNSIVFTDQCECLLQKREPNNVVEEYRLEAPKIRMEFVDDKEGQAIAATQDLKHIEAVGGGVTLGIFTRVSDANSLSGPFQTAVGELLAGAEMICQSFECDPNKGHEIFTATGPGTIILNNAKAVLGGASEKKKEPYYAALQGFETMAYYVADNKIVADTHDPNVPLQFQYVPVTNDPNASDMEGQANHIEIHLVKTKAGQTEMSTLRATGNVSVTHGQHQFTGGELYYSHKTMALMIRSGKDGQTCTIDGMPLPGIDYNLTTGQLDTSLTNLSVFPFN